MEEKEILIWIDGIYHGIEIANTHLEDHNLKIEPPNKKEIIEKYQNDYCKKPNNRK